MKFTTKSLLQVLACTVATLGAVSLVHAGANPNVDVSGTWTWTGGGFGGRGGGGGGGGFGGGGGGGAAGTNVLVLKADVSSGVVTGTLTPAVGGGGGRGGRRGGGGGGGGGGGADAGAAPAAPTPVTISNGKIAGNVLTFDVTRPARGGGADTTTSYKATVSSDGKTLTGTQVTPAAFTAAKQ